MNKKSLTNPFELFTYQGPEYFCDREEELEELIDAFDNRRNIVIASPRRLGKTNLIHHFHNFLSQRDNSICIYVDVMNTSSDEQFLNVFITAVLNAISTKESAISKFSEIFRNLQPEISFDPITNLPNFKLNLSKIEEYTFSFDAIMNLLKTRPENIQIAIDEFQQIEHYEVKSRIDATLRGHFPTARNLHFVFSGSEDHLLTTLFRDTNRPLFSSTGWMKIGLIDYDKYHKFIKYHFDNSDISLTDQEIYEILKWTEGYTFYTHYLCNLIFLYAKKNYSNVVNLCKAKCIKEYESSFHMYKRTLPKNQFEVIKAIAKENEVQEIFGKAFLNKYYLSASSVKQSIEALVKKQFVRELYDGEKLTYKVYDIFFKNWLQEL